MRRILGVLLALSVSAPMPAAATGVYLDGPAHTIHGYERWLGGRVDYRVMFPGHRQGWQHTKDATRQVLDGGYRNGNRTLVLSLPLVTANDQGGPCAALHRNGWGATDWFWNWLGQAIRARGMHRPFPDGRPQVVLRMGWEHNGTWFPWSSIDCPWEYAQAWQRAWYGVATQLPARDGVKWSWDVASDMGDPRGAWPGGFFVDYIGMSFYDMGVDPSSRAGGLPFLLQLSRWFDKPMAIPEWGIGPWRPAGMVAGFVRFVADFVDANASRVAFSAYFEQGGYRLRGSQFTEAVDVYRERFG